MAQWIVRWLVIIGTWVRFPGPPKTIICYFSSPNHVQVPKAGSPYAFTHPKAKWLAKQI